MNKSNVNYCSNETKTVALQTSHFVRIITLQAFLLLLFSVFCFLFFVRAAHAQSCPLPTIPTNVLVEYPGCQGDNCSLAQAACTWGAVAGATGYSVKITEVDTTTVIKSETVTSNNTYLFPVTQNRTYRCEVAAINSCGTGASAQHELLCKVEGLTTTQKSCGLPCADQSECIAGTTCISTSNGGSVCAVAGSQTACQSSPGIATCCSATPVGGNPPTVGTTENLFMIAGVGSFLIFFGSLFFLKNRG